MTEEQYARLEALAKNEAKPLGTLLREAAEVVYLRKARRGQKARAVRYLLSLPGTEAPEDFQEWERQYLDQRASEHG